MTQEHDVITYLKRGLNSNVLCELGGDGINFPKGSDCLEFFRPDIVIIQLGIVDCAPRLIKTRSIHRKLVNFMPAAFRMKYLTFLKRFRGRTASRVDVKLSAFKGNIENYIARAKVQSVQKLIFIGIALPDASFVSKSPQIESNVINYNSVLRSASLSENFVYFMEPLNSKVHEGIFVDGYHPNEKGHSIIWSYIKSELLHENIN